MPQDEDDIILHQDEVEQVIDDAITEKLLNKNAVDLLPPEEEDVAVIVEKLNEVIMALRSVSIVQGSDD